GAPLLVGGLSHLRRLAVRHTSLTEAGLAPLCSLPLSRLEVDRAAFGIEAIARLAGSACQETLTELRLYAGRTKHRPSPAVVPTLPRLRRLALSSCGVSADAMATLARTPLLGGLEMLDLSFNQFGAAGLGSFLDSGLAGPPTLLLQSCGLGDEGAARLASWPGLASGRHLSLAANNVGDRGLQALAAAPHASALEALNLNYNEGFTEAGLTALLRSPACARLRWLSLVGALKPRMAPALAANAPEGLRELHRSTRKGGESEFAMLRSLRAALPNCAIG